MSTVSSSTKPPLTANQIQILEEAAEPPLQGLRLRALLVGVPLVAILSYITVYASLTKRIATGTFQIIPQAVILLFLLALCNRAAARLARRKLLSQTDLVIVYAMMTVAVFVASFGAIGKLLPVLPFLSYYGTTGNKWGELITSHLPGWILPFSPAAAVSATPQALVHFYEGLPPGAALPWTIWVGPLCAWFALIALVLFVFSCLATLLRRQWVDHEHLRFPLTMLPMAIIENKIENAPFWTNRTMWMGFGVALCFWTINGWAANNPYVPAVKTMIWLDQLFTERPWNAIGYFWFTYSLSLIALAYFLPADLLFSVWFFYLLNRYQIVLFTQFGAIPTDMQMNDVTSWGGHQAAGAFLTIIAMQARIAWPYFKRVWKTAWASPGTPDMLDDSQEMMSYRTAIIGLLFGFLGIVVWLVLAGMNPLIAAVQMGVFIFVISLVLSRAVNEGGWLQAEAGFMPYHLISMVTPLSSLGAANNAMLGLTNAVFLRDIRGSLLSPLMDFQKLASSTGTTCRALLSPLALATVLSFVTAAATFLWFTYQYGALSYNSNSRGALTEIFGNAAANTQNAGWHSDGVAMSGLIVGILVTALLTMGRLHYTWFPLHPLGYAVSFSRGAFVLWFSFLVAWVLKTTVMKYGGASTYRATIPFALGIILGEFAMQTFWMVTSISLDWKMPFFLN